MTYTNKFGFDIIRRVNDLKLIFDRGGRHGLISFA